MGLHQRTVISTIKNTVFKSLIFPVLLIPNIGFGDEFNDDDPYYQVANLFHQRASSFACEWVSTTLAEIKQKNEAQVQSDLDTALTLLNIDVNIERNLDSQSKPKTKERIIHGLESICKIARTTMLVGARSVSLTNGTILNAVATLFASPISFFRGLVDRKHDETLGPRSDFLYRVMGPKKGIPLYVLGNFVSELPILLLKPSSAIPGLNISIAIEMITNYRCHDVNELNDEQKRFCNQYNTMKNFFYQASTSSFAAGKKIQSLRDQKIIKNRADLTSEDFCKLDFKEQMRRARMALERYDFFKNSSIFYLGFILPIHKNSCVKIIIKTEKQAELDALKSQKTSVEGINIVYLLKEEYPKEDYYTQAELNQMPYVDQLCHDVMRMKYHGLSAGRLSSLGDLLKSSLAPELLAEPEHAEVMVPDELLRKGNTAPLRNIVFSIGLSQSDRAAAEELLKEQKKLSREVKNDYKKVIHSDSFQECQNTTQNLSIPLDVFKEKIARLTEISQQKIMLTHRDQKAIELFFKRKERFLKLKWELITQNDLQTMSNALKDNTIANVVIISHANGEGYLVDSKSQEIPRGAFSVISPSILSLNFYYCYSQKVAQLYNLKEKLNSESYYKVRYLTTVKQNDFLNGDAYAPIAAFGSYLYRLDHFLSASKKGAHLLQKHYGRNFADYHEPAMCEADLSQVEIEKGTYAVILNDQYLGTISDQDSSVKLSYPCSFLKSEKNKLVIQNIINAGGSRIANPDTFTVQIGEKLVPVTPAFLKTSSKIILKF